MGLFFSFKLRISNLKYDVLTAVQCMYDSSLGGCGYCTACGTCLWFEHTQVGCFNWASNPSGAVIDLICSLPLFSSRAEQ